jgi:hypothetical protein
MVKVTETYNPTTKVAEDKTLEVVFTRTTNTQTTELQTGMDTYVATAEDITIERLTDEPGNVVIKNVANHEFRALNGDIVLEDWTSGEEDTITFTFEETITDITIESRSTDASISFTAFEGFTYEVKSGEISIKANLKDNQEDDLNVKEGVITIKGLIQGLPYDVHYSGNVVLETITQDEVDGQVDKLYVLYQYTFISFVPLTLNYRIQSGELLEKDYDDVAIYDKTNYYSDATRQSFVVDNETGLIYRIENVHVEMISRGILWFQNNLVPHDLRINSIGDLEFFPLFTNTTIIAIDAFKDKYGNTFVFNNRLNVVDIATKTTFFVSYVSPNGFPNSQLRRIYQSGINKDQLNVSGFARGLTYWLTEKNEVLQVEADLNNPNNRSQWIKSVKLVSDKHNKVDVPLDFESIIYDFQSYDHNRTLIPKPYKISRGRLFSEVLSNNLIFNNGRPGLSPFREWGELAVYDWTRKNLVFFELSGYPSTPWNPSHLIDKDMLIEYSNGNIYTIYDVSDFLSEMMDFSIDSADDTIGYRFNWGFGDSIINLFENSVEPHWKNFKDNNNLILKYELVLEDVGIVNGEVFRFGVSGNITYDLILEVIDGKPTLVPYITGTYIAPPPAPITFQPINR